ncbi:transporter substrate-binding domain-containing protein [Agrobacterium vitis]|uniref:Transporter substrate-binding domain-containing protein n=1 Tax=Agrobacterium vitis TaxID=373 RepID=A0A6I4FYV9_AGRVI|nr:transporter substrate-binding domain-containing protein [Agrobacterium vitis]MCF1452519.1 transporter substrate-binding domain-containing protein [Agrobacterium vitis]MUZ76149.1 transporter substrate-binding domain-containing protein [Agrobacterium vitis]MVA54616.1 transporter substrate-binding domain-containing protein [Agrobacterium vitis]MVA78258.1 transporter substrate-binding domain-containing protein [Agrobacterium vitis]BCH56257.1 amino acid ABC transporter [Agrobacterium vitis]
MLSATMTKTIFGFVLSISALVATQASADATLDRIKGRGKLTVGVILSGAPFGYIDPKTQEQKGFNVDIAQALADDLGVKLETVTVTPPNRVQFLQQGKVDILIANMQYTEDRAKVLDFVPTPYDRSGGAAVVRKDSGLKDWADLKGKPVCVSQGSNYTQPLIEEYGAIVKALPSQPESLLALQGGNCVAAVHVGATVGLLLQDRPEEWKDYAIPFPTELVPSDSVIWLRKGEKDTQAALDSAVKKLHVSGKLLDFAKSSRLLNTDYLEQEHKALAATK